MTCAPKDEEELLTRAQAGDRDAIGLLFERYGDALYGRVILPRLGRPAEAEEILCETFLTLLEKVDRITWRGVSVYSWLRRVAVNKIIDRARRRGREAPLPDDPERLPAVDGPGADESLSHAQDQRANEARVREAMAKIAPRYSEAIELRLLCELTREDCAARLGVTVGNFDVILHRALKAFAKAFSGAADGNEP